MNIIAVFALIWGFSTVVRGVDVTFLEKDQPELEIEVTLTHEEATPKIVKQGVQTFSRLEVGQEGFQTGHEGTPEIPRIHRWLAVSPKSKYQIQIIPGKLRVYKNILLYPAQADVLEGEEPAFTINKAAYLKSKWIGQQTVVLGPRAKLGRATIQPVSFFPAAYHPLKRELRVFENFKVRLVRENPEFEDEPVVLSQFSAEQISRLTLNGSFFLSRFAQRSAEKNYVIIYAKNFKAQVQDLAQIYQTQGVRVMLVESETSPSPTALKNVLNTHFQNLNLDSVLFFGDDKVLPFQDYGGYLSDFAYSLLSGSDQISDVSVGRLPVSNQTQATMILNKIKRYEELKASGVINKRVMLVAHYQGYPQKYTGNMEAVRKSPNPRGLEFNTQYGGEEATNESLLKESQKGYSIINYRGHGSTGSWSGWGSDGASFSSSQVKQLPTDDKSLSFIFNVACNNGAIQQSNTALVERQLFPSESNDSLQGAVGTFGATKPSLTEVNHRFNLHLFQFLQESEDISIGNIFTLANNKLSQTNGGKASSNTKMYVLYSDPLLAPWID